MSIICHCTYSNMLSRCSMFESFNEQPKCKFFSGFEGEKCRNIRNFITSDYCSSFDAQLSAMADLGDQSETDNS